MAHPKDLTDSQKDIAAIVERNLSERTPKPVDPDSSISSDQLEVAILKHERACQGPGGPIHTLGTKIDELSTKMAERRGADAVWAKLTLVAVPVCCVLLAAFLQYKFTQFQQLQEKVALQLKVAHARIEAQDQQALATLQPKGVTP